MSNNFLSYETLPSHLESRSLTVVEKGQTGKASGQIVADSGKPDDDDYFSFRFSWANDGEKEIIYMEYQLIKTGGLTLPFSTAFNRDCLTTKAISNPEDGGRIVLRQFLCAPVGRIAKDVFDTTVDYFLYDSEQCIVGLPKEGSSQWDKLDDPVQIF